MNLRTRRPGFVFLISALVIGAIAVSATLSLLLLGGAAERTGATLFDSAQAFQFAHTCMERTLRTLRSDLSYVGGETVTFTHGSCVVRPIAGTGNEDRAVCVEGRSGKTVRRMELWVHELFPTVLVDSWTEVSFFTRC